MKLTLRTTVPVIHIDIEKIVTGGTRTGIVTFDLVACAFISNKNGEQRLEAQYQYIDDAGKVLPTSDNGVKVIKGQITELSASFGNSAASFPEHMAKDIEAFVRQEMVERFLGLQVEQIEKVTE